MGRTNSLLTYLVPPTTVRMLSPSYLPHQPKIVISIGLPLPSESPNTSSIVCTQ